MYHYRLNIHIISDDFSLESQLKKVPPVEGFDHWICTFDQAPMGLKDCDILIIEQCGQNLKTIISNASETAKIILCGEGLHLADIEDCLLEKCHSLWIKPYSERLAVSRFKKVLSQIKTEKDLFLTETYLDTVLDSIPDLIWFKDIRGSHLKVNEAFCQAVGKVKSDVQGRGHYYIWDLEPDEYADGEYVCLETEEEVLRRKETCLFDEKVKSKKGLRQFKTYKSPIFDENRELIGTVGVAHDITDLENVTAELEIVLRSIPFAVLIKNSDNIIINCNDRFYEYFTTDIEHTIGKDFVQWKQQAFDSIGDTDHEGDFEGRIHLDGEDRIVEIHEEPIYDIFNNLAGWLYICRDVTVERHLKQQIVNKSNTDFLTGLHNRRYFYEYVSQYRADQRVTLIYLDLDHFKQVNDTYGHQAGDQALILTAQIMENCFQDAFIARLGGDEFLITLLGVYTIQDAEQRSLKMQRQMHEAFEKNQRFHGLSVSIGIAQTEDPSENIDVLMQKSDIALYQAKENGRACCCTFSK